jgi:hypothetical protein
MVADSMVASVLFKILNKSHAVMLRDRLQPSGPNCRRHHSEQCAHDPLTVSLSRQGASRILRSENLADVIARDIAPLPSPAAAN